MTQSQLYLFRMPGADAALDAAAFEMLNAAQRMRLAAVMRPKRARQYLWSRVLANAWGMAAGIAFTEDFPRGRAHPCSGGFFTSLAHSGDAVLFGAARSPLAVDVETVRPRDWKSAAPFAFCADECRRIEQSPQPLAAFYEAWVAHECRIKWPEGVDPETVGVRQRILHRENLVIGVLGADEPQLIEGDALAAALPVLGVLLGRAFPSRADAENKFRNRQD